MKRYFNGTFLGAGGEHPRIDVFDLDTGCIQNIMSLPQMHSVYAVDTDPKNGEIAIGTKGGLIHIIAQGTKLEQNQFLQPTTLLQGAPVTSVCWTSESFLAASDITGRCLLWNTNSRTNPRMLKALKGVDCHLLTLTDGILAGLSSRGKLIFCHPFEDKLVHATDTPPLPSKIGLEKMVYWKAGDALVFPSKGGHLTIIYLKDYRIRDLAAHDGSLYAISICGDGLVTSGMDDSRLKIWFPDFNKTAQDIKLAEGIIASATVCQFPQSKIMLIDSKGRAATYILDGEKLQLERRFPGEGYRSIKAPDHENLMVGHNEQTKKRVFDIIGEIQEKGPRLPPDDIAKKHSQLIELGYKHVSLGIRIADAVHSEDISEGIRLYTSLMRIIPLDNPNSCPSMEKYMALLEKAWQLNEANALCDKIISINPNYTFTVGSREIGHVAQLMEDNKHIIELDLPIDQVIKSATAIGKQFSGRFVIGNTKPEICNRMRLTSNMIVEKYALIRMETGGENLPEAIAEKVWWMKSGQADQVDVVVCKTEQTDENKGLQFILQVYTGELNTVVVPVIIFNMDEIETGESIQKENDKAQAMLAQLQNTTFSNSYLTAIHWAMNQALRRLVTEHSPNRRI